MRNGAFDHYRKGGRIPSYVHAGRNRVGHNTMAVKSMSNIYYTMPTEKLTTLRSKKFVELQKLRRKPGSYLTMQDIRKLSQQIRWIDAVLFAREAQVRLF